ncbi:MAG: hypothetical protein ACM3XR_05220 [Bacillota bacterium]
MYEFISRQAAEHGDRAAMIPVGRLKDIREDIEHLKARYELNDYQRHIVDEFYKFDLPKTGFEICSIIIVASPSPAMTYVGFHWHSLSTPAAA